MLVSKWGNSLAVRLPAAVVDALALKEGDEIEIQVTGERNFEISKRPDAHALLARLREYRGRLPADFKFDRLEAHER
jgi:antitoxin MazE